MYFFFGQDMEAKPPVVRGHWGSRGKACSHQRRGVWWAKPPATGGLGVVVKFLIKNKPIGGHKSLIR